MTTIFVQFVGEIDNADCFKRAFFNAYPAAAAKLLADYDLVFFKTDCFDSAANHGTVFDTHLVAFFGLAFVIIHYSDAGHE